MNVFHEVFIDSYKLLSVILTAHLRQLVQVHQYQSALVRPPQHQPQQVSVLQRQQFTRHIQVPAQVFQQQRH